MLHQSCKHFFKFNKVLGLHFKYFEDFYSSTIHMINQSSI